MIVGTGGDGSFLGNRPLMLGIVHLKMMNSTGKAGHQLVILRLLRLRLADILIWEGSPFVEIVDRLDAGLQHLFRASEAWPHGCIESAALDGDSESRGGKDRILLRMHADAKIVRFAGSVCFVAVGAAVASIIETVHHVGGSSVVSGRDNAVIFHDDRSDPIALAVGPEAHCHRDGHEIFVSIFARAARC